MTTETTKKILTDVELEVMKVVWELGPCTVREVYARLQESRPLAYTTVLTMMTILEQKGHLKRTGKSGRAHTYAPTQDRRLVLKKMVQDFLGRVFDGSARPLLLSLLEEKKVSQEDLDLLAKLIKEKKR